MSRADRCARCGFRPKAHRVVLAQHADGGPRFALSDLCLDCELVERTGDVFPRKKRAKKKTT